MSSMWSQGKHGECGQDSGQLACLKGCHQSAGGKGLALVQVTLLIIIVSSDFLTFLLYWKDCRDAEYSSQLCWSCRYCVQGQQVHWGKFLLHCNYLAPVSRSIFFNYMSLWNPLEHWYFQHLHFHWPDQGKSHLLHLTTQAMRGQQGSKDMEADQ